MNKKTKKIIATSGVILTLGTNIPNVNALETTQTNSNAQIVIRPGEYPNKPGKRLTGIDANFDINCPIRWDKQTGYHIQEYDLNYLISVRIVNYLQQKGVNVVLLETNGKSEDLGSAAKRAKQYNPQIYLSIHNNSYRNTDEGYFIMTNPDDKKSSEFAIDMSNALTSNPMLIPKKDNRYNTGYISEMNKKPGSEINLLMEMSFALSNPNEAKKVVNEQQLDFYAKTIGDELIKTLNQLNN